MLNFSEKINKLFSLTETKYHGIEEGKIALIEKRLNIRLPGVLRNYYLLFGRNKKLNINDVLFRIEDIYIEENQFLVIGKQYPLDRLFGINLKDIRKKNPNIYHKCWEFYQETFKQVQEWVDWKEPLEVFLFEQIIDSGLDGGFRYCFDYENGHTKELSADQSAFIKSKLLEMCSVEIKNISMDTIKYYTTDYSFILYLHLSHANIEYVSFGTEDKEIYKKIFTLFHKKGINIKRIKKTYSYDYEIYNKRILGPIVEIYPGKYDGYNPKKRKNSIFLHENAVRKFYDLLIKVNKKFDIYGISTVYNGKQVNILINELSGRLYKMKNDRNFHFIDWEGN